MFISVDKVDGAEKARAAYDVPFPLLADPDAKVHEAFEVINDVPPERVAWLKSKGLDIEQWSGKTHHKIAIPAMFLIDQKNTVRWAHAAKDYKTRPKVSAVLAALDKALGDGDTER